MNREQYFVIVCSEDGPSVAQLSKVELEARIAEGWWGDGDNAPQWGTTMPDLESCEGAIIIKGVAVVPKPKQVVKSWELP